MTQKGQIVDKSKSKGLGVCEMWVKLFQENEANFKAKKIKRVLLDKQITEIMLQSFPSRNDSKILHMPNKVRGRYNRGILTHGKRPRIRSYKYERNGSGNLMQVKTKKKGD